MVEKSEEMLEGMLYKCNKLSSVSPEEAVGCYTDIIKFKPASGITWYLKGLCLYNLGKFEEATECLDKSIDLEPKQILPWRVKSLCFYSLLKFDEAIKCFDKILIKIPRDIGTLFLMSTCYILKGEYKMADVYLKKAMSIDASKTSKLLQDFVDSTLIKNPEVSDSDKLKISKALNEINKNF